MEKSEMNFSDISPFVRFARYFRTEKTSVFSENVPLDCRLFYVTDGDGKMEVDGRILSLARGDVIIINAGTPYRLIPPENVLTFLAVNFDYTGNFSDRKTPIPPSRTGAKPLERVTFTDFPEFSDFVHISSMQGIADRLLRIEREYSKSALLGEKILSALLSDVLIECVRKSVSGTLKSGVEKTDAILAYVREHFKDNPTNKVLGEKFGFHPNYISRIVKEQTGMPLHKYLTFLKISRAVSLLDSGSKSVTETAEECGFCDIYYFSRYFKQYTGVSPTEWRGKTAGSD